MFNQWHKNGRSRPIKSTEVTTGRNAEHVALKDSGYARCGHCGFMCHDSRDASLGGKAGVGTVLTNTVVWTSPPLMNGYPLKSFGDITLMSNVDLDTKLLLDGEQDDAVFTDSASTPKTITNNSVLYSTTHKMGLGAMFFPGGNDTYTKLLLHGDMTPIVDSSSGGKAITATNAVYSTTQKVFGTGSVYFDGTGDCLSTADSADFNFAAGDFTIDGNFFFSDVTTASERTIASQYHTTGNQRGWIFAWKQSDAKLYFYYSVDAGASVTSKSVSWTPTVDTWYHLVVVRNGNDLKFFVNGVQRGATQDVTGVTIFDSSEQLGIGANKTSGSPGSFFIGYMDELRISKGIARWTANFTPPVAAYAASYLSLADSDDWSFGTVDFTIDFWIKRGVLGTVQNICGQRANSNNTWILYLSATNQIGYYNYISAYQGQYISAANVINDTDWHHVAFVRTATTSKLFVDGVSKTLTETTAFGTNDLGNITAALEVGRNGSAGAFLEQTYLDELRISKGVARWTSNFAVPPVAYTVTQDSYDVVDPVVNEGCPLCGAFTWK